MPMIRLKKETLQLLREGTLPRFDFVMAGTPRKDGDYDVPVDDEVAMAIAKARLPGESDDDVVVRRMREVTGRKPD